MIGLDIPFPRNRLAMNATATAVAESLVPGICAAVTFVPSDEWLSRRGVERDDTFTYPNS